MEKPAAFSAIWQCPCLKCEAKLLIDELVIDTCLKKQKPNKKTENFLSTQACQAHLFSLKASQFCRQKFREKFILTKSFIARWSLQAYRLWKKPCVLISCGGEIAFLCWVNFTKWLCPCNFSPKEYHLRSNWRARTLGFTIYLQTYNKGMFENLLHLVDILRKRLYVPFLLEEGPHSIETRTGERKVGFLSFYLLLIYIF